MTEEEEVISSNCGLIQNSIPESNPPVKKKRNLPGNPGIYIHMYAAT